VTVALSASQRGQLERLVGRARALLENDLAAQAAGRFGIDRDGTLADADNLRLDPAGLAIRRELVNVLEHLRSEGEDPVGAVARLLREAVFTHLNRLVAIRIAEALRLLPASLADGRRSQGFQELLELAPLLAGDDTGGYWAYLRLCGDELAGDVPALFDPRNPLLTLTPSPGALDGLIELLADPAHIELWAAPDCLGWVYQFFNTADERRAMREASQAPRTSRELAVRNQFFTPRYVVDFLVQNSLGRRLLEADPTSPLLDELPLLVDPPAEAGAPVDLDEVCVLDPACGSGHFLLAAYDVLERAWQHAGVPPDKAAPRIVAALWGIDIDPRCTQVAAAAILFRARHSCPTGDLPRPNVICGRALPATSTGLSELLEMLPPAHRQLVERLTDALADAPVLGPLLRVEERLTTELRAALFGGASGPGTLAEVIPTEALQALQDDLLAALQSLADATTATPAERLLAAEADDAIRFVHALQRRYDAVLMNPPFGEPVSETKPYLKQAYPWMPKIYDLLAAFVGRGLELCKPKGYVGAITSRAGLFLTTFEKWRHQVLLGHHLVALADLGYGVMEQAMVEAAAYVVGATPSRPDHHATFVRLLKDADRPSGLAAAVAASRAGYLDRRVFTVDLTDLHAVPGSPVAYWMSPSIRRLFTDFPPLEGHGAEVRQGLATADDFRFVRAFWEVDPIRIGRTREETRCGKRWTPFAKGGEYSPYWSDVHLLVDWEKDGERIKEHVNRQYPYLRGKVEWVVKNQEYYFRPGLTWPRRTQAGFNPSILPAGCVFADKGPAIFFPDIEASVALLAWLTSRPLNVLLESITAFGAYEVGAVQRLPWPGPSLSALDRLGLIARRIAAAKRSALASHESSSNFVCPSILMAGVSVELSSSVQRVWAARARLSAELLNDYAEAEELLLKELGTGPETRAYLDEERGPLPNRPPNKETSPYVGSIPWIVDPYIEALAHQQGQRLDLVVGAAERGDLLPPDEPKLSADDLFSYLVGVAFGRWDVRIGGDPSRASPLPDLFDPVLLCPPGALVDDDGLPAREAPPGYPLELPPGRVLLDEPGHRWDVEARIAAAADWLFDDAEAVMSELLKILGRRSVRNQLRRRFFNDHLSRYSKSRRKAPIYWPLYVPSGAWGVWVYAPLLSRETLYVVARAAADRLDGAEAETRRLQRERESGGAGRSAREVANALEAEQRLAEELRRFRAEAERVAGLGWDPDLDDGIILCAAPLAYLFSAWRDATTARKELQAGKYPWATVSRWAKQL
jgi:hypothetical protein